MMIPAAKAVGTPLPCYGTGGLGTYAGSCHNRWYSAPLASHPVVPHPALSITV